MKKNDDSNYNNKTLWITAAVNRVLDYSNTDITGWNPDLGMYVRLLSSMLVLFVPSEYWRRSTPTLFTRGTGWQRSRNSSSGRVKNFLFSTSSTPTLKPTQPLVEWVRALSLGVKRQGREADDSHPASADVKKIWMYISTPPYALMA
jgi:hypothetical protein